MHTVEPSCKTELQFPTEKGVDALESASFCAHSSSVAQSGEEASSLESAAHAIMVAETTASSVTGRRRLLMMQAPCSLECTSGQGRVDVAAHKSPIQVRP